MSKKQSLGRGLDNIFLENTVSDPKETVSKLPLDEIEPKKDQPRTNFDSESLAQLAESIGIHGVLEPVLVRELPTGGYQIIAGERRWRASKLAGLSEIPCIVLDTDELKASQISLIENLQREDLNPVEEAQAYYSLISQFDLTQEELSRQLGKSRSAISNSLRFLDLPDHTLSLLGTGELSPGHCKVLLGLKDKSAIDETADMISLKTLSVRESEKLVNKLNKQKDEPSDDEEETFSVDYTADLENRISSIMKGRKCKLNIKGSVHSLKFDFTDNDDLDELLSDLFGEKIKKDF